MAWSDMGRQAWKAAVDLGKLRNRRSCVSRAYYAAFSAVTAEIRKITTDFPKGFEHPPHPQLGKAVKKHLTHFSKHDRDELRDALSRLYSARLDADYRHEAEPDADSTRNALRDARYVLQSMGEI